MKKIYIKIKGMHCQSCEIKISKGLRKINNVISVNFNKDIAIVEYESLIDKDHIVNIITKLGYITRTDLICDNIDDIKTRTTIKEFLIILTFLVIVFISLKQIFNFNLLNVIPTIDNSMSLKYLFIIGLFTSIHCVSMCGGINLLASINKRRSIKNPFLYNIGRLVSYTILGGIFGAIGSVFKINSYINGVIIIIAAVFMFVMSLTMLNITNLNVNKLFPKLSIKFRSNKPFIIGLLNGFMPCGPLQAMQIYALSTGSILMGAASMFFFSLGTIPLMFLLGLIVNIINTKRKILINKISAVLILILSFVMLNRGLLSVGIDFSNINKIDYSNYLKSTIVDEYQVVEFDLTYNGYQDIVVQKGIPVKIIINANIRALTGCNNEIKLNKFGITQKLHSGENVIEFIPQEVGNYFYTCWMDMYKNNIIVIDNISYFKSDL